jgi:AcrR family transcriptional regulator
MAVYTYFGGMDELSRAVREEGFERFGAHLDEVLEQADAVAELFALGRAYMQSATDDPDLYRFMFMERPKDEHAEVGLDTFGRVVAAAARAIESGRLRSKYPDEVARKCWMAVHGSVSLHLVGMLSEEEARAGLTGLLADLFVGLGDDKAATTRSVRRANARWARSRSG